MELLEYLKTETVDDWPGLVHPSLLCCVGSTGTGKTVFTSKFVDALRTLFVGDGVEFHKIVICSAVNQPIYATMFENAKRQFPSIECVYYETLQLSELKSEKFLGAADRNTLLILDDLIATVAGSDGLREWMLDLINVRVHHTNTFLIV